MTSNSMQLVIALPLGIFFGLLFCGVGGAMLKLSCYVYNIRRTPQKDVFAESPEENEETETIEYTTVEAGPYTSPVTFARHPVKQVDDTNTSEENVVPMPTLLSGAQITFLSWILGAFSLVFLFGLVGAWDQSRGWQPMLAGIALILGVAVPVMVHSLVVALWLKTSFRKGLVLSVFCGIQWFMLVVVLKNTALLLNSIGSL